MGRRVSIILAITPNLSTADHLDKGSSMRYRRRVREALFQARGQALIEYALILVLVVMAMAIALAATGPAISNIFSNTVYNLIGLSGTPIETIQRLGGASSSFWATVTEVARNPQAEVPYPTNPPAPATTTNTPGPSPTPSNTVVPPTPSDTPTQRPTSTPVDQAFIAPFYDSVDTPERWRLDSSVWIGGDDWYGEYYANPTWSGAPQHTLWNQQIDPTLVWNMNWDWGNGSPIVQPPWLTDGFSIRFTRQIYVPAGPSMNVRFTTSADYQVRLRIDLLQAGSPVDILPLSTGGTTIYAIPPGFHDLILEYAEDTGPARVSLTISNAGGVNPDDTGLPTGAAECSWGPVNSSRANTSVNLPNMWDSDTINPEFPTNRRCHLELRGYVDLTPLTNPKMTFWDYWDLSNSAGTRTYLEIAEYNTNRASMVWRRVDLHTGPTTNYSWTMQTVDLTNVAGTNFAGKRIALRFVMENNANSTPARRWYIDDVLIDNFDTNRDYQVCQGSKTTCGSYWNLNDTSQRASFITSGRWDLTANNVQVSGSGTQLSWDDSPNTAYVDNWEGGPRVHSLEFRGWINLTNLPASGVGGVPDADGDDGKPMLSFYMAYDVDAGDRLVLQYTRDPYNAGNGANWTDWVTLVDASAGRQTNITMQFKEQLLDTIPNWNSQRFRLRFALYVTGTNSSNAQGVYIDEIYLERENKPAFSPYPFLDGGENGIDLWRPEAQWGITNASGVFNSPYSFTDSPTGNYPNGLNSSLQLKGAIDLNNNTPENISLYGGNKGYDGSQGTPANTAGPSNRPYLTFWHWRSVAANESINVDISNNDGASWTTIWTWDYLTHGSRTARQIAWERVEIDLLRAVEQMTGQTWNTIATNPNLTDDDILIRFRLDARSVSSVSDGVYIDNISIANYSEVSHKLWDVSASPTTGGCSGSPTPPCGNGNGIIYEDDVDSPADWWTRWHTGGSWAGVSLSNAQHSGLLGFHDSPPNNTNYQNDVYAVLQMNRIIDLRGVSASQRPTMYFWTRYNLGSQDSIQVQVSPENPASTTQGYERVARWDPWENPDSDDRFQTSTTNSMIGGPTSSGVRLDTWIRVQIDLSAYAGRRIKVRFVLDALDDGSNLRDGWFIDDVRFELRTPRVFNLPFFDNAQNTQNWVVEGIWGLDAEKFRGSGGGPASLGPDPWFAYWFDCELAVQTNIPPLPSTFTGCTSTSRYSTLLTLPGSERHLPEGPYLDIIYDFGSTGRPPGALSGSAGSTWDNQYAARFERDITVAAGQFTFITVSDDGVRLRYVLNAACDVDDPPPNEGLPPTGPWNIINNWSFHGRTVDMNTVTLPAGNHCLVLEYFEATGDAVIILTAGNNTFSYSDSPKLVAGTPAIDSVPYGNSALMLDGVLNLVGATSPVLEFWTQYDLNPNTFARVEISQDGGFTWEQNTSMGTGGTCDPNSYCNPTIGSSSSDVISAAGTWEQRRHNLTAFAGRQIGLRFRLQTSNSTDDGWWFTDIQVNQ